MERTCLRKQDLMDIEMFHITTQLGNAMSHPVSKTLMTEACMANLNTDEVRDTVSQIYHNEIANTLSFGSYNFIFGYQDPPAKFNINNELIDVQR